MPRPRNVNEFGEKKCGDVGKELSEQESDMDEGMEGCKQGEREETKGRTGNRDETMGVSLGAMAQGHLVGVRDAIVVAYVGCLDGGCSVPIIIACAA